MLTLIAETIEWHRDPADLPDADTTVMIELDPAFDYSEPVFLGFFGDGVWHEVHGEVVEIIAWAHLPVGSRAAAGVLGTAELGPDGKEWAKTEAGYAHVTSMLPRKDGEHFGPFWYGWALREAFVAGAEWQEKRASGVRVDAPDRLDAMLDHGHSIFSKAPTDGVQEAPHAKP